MTGDVLGPGPQALMADSPVLLGAPASQPRPGGTFQGVIAWMLGMHAAHIVSLPLDTPCVWFTCSVHCLVRSQGAGLAELP